MNEHRIDISFPTAILVKDNILLNELESFEKLLKDYLQKNKENFKKFYTSKHINNYNFSTTDDIFKNNLFLNLKNEILLNCSIFCKELGYSEEQISSYNVGNMWANLIKKNDYHGMHTHAGTGNALISGVFYVTAPQSASLMLENPYYYSYVPEKPKNDNFLNFKHIKYPCLPGRLILFKSYTKHGYDSHLSEKDKISIAFNYGRNCN